MGTLENGFERVGGAISRRPWTSILLSALITLGIGSGFFTTLEDELRPEKQVPEGAVALDHLAYVSAKYPSNQRFNSWIGTCAVPGCNMFHAEYIQELRAIHQKILDIEVDGASVKTSPKISASENYKKVDQATWDAKFGGTWSFNGDGSSSKKCFQLGGGICGQSSLLEVWDRDTATIDALNDGTALSDINAEADLNLVTVASSGTGGPAGSPGSYTSAKALYGFYSLSETKMLIEGKEVDPISDEWERLALCVLGIQTEGFDDACPANDKIVFSANFRRSLSDEFGSTISADIPLLAGAIGGIIVYLAVFLSRSDTVYSKIGISIAVVVAVVLSWMGGMGLGAFMGLMNNNLSNNIPFLLLGLGVDDAFVLAAEFQRAKKLDPAATPEDRMIAASKHGGVSILITSATDALAFLVGSATVLPALSWFCAFAGMGIVFCFLLQIFFILPALLINARREERNELDVLCCVKAGAPHDYDAPQGCCNKFTVAPGKLTRMFTRFGEWVTTSTGLAITCVFWLAVLIVGIVGCTKVYKDFELEWFIPDDSYIRTYYAENDAYFASGVPTSVYVKDVDYHAHQDAMTEMHSWLNTTKYVDQEEPIKDWFNAFITKQRDSNPSMMQSSAGCPAGCFNTKADFDDQLAIWISSTENAMHRSSLIWKDADCNAPKSVTDSGCNLNDGLDSSKFGFTLALAYVDGGQQRYDTMVALRAQINSIFPAADGIAEPAFPFARQFTNWEEVGIIDKELIRNLAICGGVIVVIVGAMIPRLKVAPFVILSIATSIVEVMGFFYWWGVTISGVSTIFLLICVGLAVDYSAHIAHFFVVSPGTSKERAIASLERIGPSTFNAVVSTLVAVIALSMSQSYVFRIFFKALFLVVLIGGGNGLWLMPALLGAFGGAAAEEKCESESTAPTKPKTSKVTSL